MPNNDNNENKFFELPQENNQNLGNQIDNTGMNQSVSPMQNSQPEQNNIIEIPQSYYDKVAKEQQEKAEAEAKMQQERMEAQEANSEIQGILLMSIVNAIAIFGVIYATLNISIPIFFALPAIVVVFSIFNAVKYKEKSTYPQTVMVGGIICAVIAFILSMINEDEADLYMYYSLATAIIGFLGMFVSSVITKLIGDFKNIKALQTIGYFLFFAALIGVPYYFEQNYHEEFYRIIFHTQVEVKAETEDEFVAKTIKARYNIEYTCDPKYTKIYINEKLRKQIVRGACVDEKGRSFTITSIAYNEGSNQYVVKDTYLDTIIINDIKEKLAKKIQIATSATNVTISLYPEENCFFYGDCADCDEYYERYQEENNIENQYKISTTANYEKYLTETPEAFLNDNKFKYIIGVHGNYGGSTYTDIADSVINVLNENGYKNNYGFIINVYNKIGGSGDEGFSNLSLKVTGDAEPSKLFGSYEIVDTSTKKNK